MGRVHIAGGPWTSATFADSTGGDLVDGEDPLVRYAATQALGPYNGTVIVAEPETGRILTIVNQKLGLTGAFQPCSTIKLVTGLAGLSESVVQADTLVPTGRRRDLTMTTAFEHSSNRYFAALGKDLGFERLVRYARTLGIGEKAGLNIDGEEPGFLPAEPPPDKEGGMGMMSSFGLDIAVTPLELTALISAIANDGTLYYLQYPRSAVDGEHLEPRVNRKLDVSRYIPAVRDGLFAAVEEGTGRKANVGGDAPVFGKTGTCTDGHSPTHLGWFASFNHGPKRRIAVVVLLTGGQPVNGPLAASVAGSVYRTLQQDNYFGIKAPVLTRASLR